MDDFDGWKFYPWINFFIHGWSLNLSCSCVKILISYFHVRFLIQKALGIIFFSNFHPKKWQIKISSISDKILPIDKIFIRQNHPWMKKSYPWIKVSSMEKMMDDFFIRGWLFHPWMKSTDKVDGWRTWTHTMPRIMSWEQCNCYRDCN